MNLSYEERYKRTAEAYAHFFESLRADTIEEVRDLVSPQVHFVDPFNDVVGRDKMVQVFEKMFADVEQPEFTILDQIWSNDLCFLRWDFSCKQKQLGYWSVRGMSELHFDAEGLVSAHYDYWDSGRNFYAKLPLIGGLIRFIMSRASI